MLSSNDYRRYHPYSLNKPNNSKVSATGSKNVSNNNQNNYANNKSNTMFSKENYQNQNYFNSINNNSRNFYPTLMQSNNKERALKDRSNTISNISSKAQAHNSKNDNINDTKSLKIWPVTTKSMQLYVEKFEVIKKNTINKKYSENLVPENYLFEIIGQLDSSISADSSLGSREFSLKDVNGRIHCIFYEIDRDLDRFVRDSWIRCIGKYNKKNNIFQCIKVRQVKDDFEKLNFGFLVNQTNSFIRSKFFE